jgi:prolipoprotein diacylglyceryl transferase
MLSLFINWDVDPELFSLGALSIRYYGLLFALAFVAGYKIEERMFKSEGLSVEWLNKLWIYVAVATIVGARLGHCFFYDWAYYREHLVEVFLPFRLSPEFRFTGFQGLASHGAGIGIIAGLWYYSRKVSKRSILWILDRAVVPIALAGCFIRLGNLMNSEIIGLPTDRPWGFLFVNAHGVDGPVVPRHPSQLYEAICYLISFGVLLYFYWRTRAKEREGFLFGMFLILIFTCRFFIEFLKENQEDFEASMLLNMGQVLSLPFILTGVVTVVHGACKAGSTARGALSWVLAGTGLLGLWLVVQTLPAAFPLSGEIAEGVRVTREWGITTGILLSCLLFLLGLADFQKYADKVGKRAINVLIIGIVSCGVSAFVFSYNWFFALLALVIWFVGYGQLQKSATFKASARAGVRILIASTVVATTGWIAVYLLPAGEVIQLVALLLHLVLLIVGWSRVRASCLQERSKENMKGNR